ncbi:MAG: hypothetical protein ACW96M_05430 [Candidatus Thorarchaeota archaeon]|jgi:hypothetical protein
MNEEAESGSEPLEIRFEKALEKRHPFMFPGIFIVVGFSFFFIFWWFSLQDVLTNHPLLDPFVLLGYPLELDYMIATALYFVFILAMMFVVYIGAVIPMTLFVTIGSKTMFTFGLSQNIASIGTKFGGIQMVLRSLLPGLFGIGFGVGALPYLISLTETPSSEWPLSFALITTLYYASLGLVIGMALFPSTWFADDSGLVIHGALKTPYRAPPRVDGAGNWLRSVFAGLTVFLYPITMIQTFILTPYLAGSLSFLDLIIGLFVMMIGLPLVMLGMSLPFVLLTERLRPRVISGIWFVARKMGAKEIELLEPSYETQEALESE